MVAGPDIEAVIPCAPFDTTGAWGGCAANMLNDMMKREDSELEIAKTYIETHNAALQKEKPQITLTIGKMIEDMYIVGVNRMKPIDLSLVLSFVIRIAAHLNTVNKVIAIKPLFLKSVDSE